MFQTLSSIPPLPAKRMRRHFKADGPAVRFRLLQGSAFAAAAAFPHCSFTTDVMVGFAERPKKNLNSPKPLLQSAASPKSTCSPIPSVRHPCRQAASGAGLHQNNRMAEMEQVAQEAWNAFLQAGIGQVQQVLLESTLTPRGRLGHTANYRPVAVPVHQGNGENWCRYRSKRREMSFALVEC